MNDILSKKCKFEISKVKLHKAAYVLQKLNLWQRLNSFPVNIYLFKSKYDTIPPLPIQGTFPLNVNKTDLDRCIELNVDKTDLDHCIELNVDKTDLDRCIELNVNKLT